MTKKELIAGLSDLIRYSLSFTKMVIESEDASVLEREVEDLNDEDFRQGLRFIIDGVSSTAIDEIFTNKIAFEKNKYARQYKTVLKRALLGIQARENPHSLLQVLMSYIDLPIKERNKTVSFIFDD
jgi:flagellar motor component MotA